jgi:hypothetical protein
MPPPPPFLYLLIFSLICCLFFFVKSWLVFVGFGCSCVLVCLMFWNVIVLSFFFLKKNGWDA